MKAAISKTKRPRYFIANDVCVRIDNIVFVQKISEVPYVVGAAQDYKCCIAVGVGEQFPIATIPCKDAIEQTAIFTQLSTMLSNL